MCCTFFKAYLPFLQGTEANKQNTTCNLHRLPKIHYQFYIEEETTPQPFFSYPEVRLGHVHSGLLASKTAKKVLELSKSDHGTEIPQSGCCDGRQLAKQWQKGGEKEAKRWHEVGKKVGEKLLQKGDKVAMIINLATNKSWLFLFDPKAKGWLGQSTLASTTHVIH